MTGGRNRGNPAQRFLHASRLGPLLFSLTLFLVIISLLSFIYLLRTRTISEKSSSTPLSCYLSSAPPSSLLRNTTISVNLSLSLDFVALFWPFSNDRFDFRYASFRSVEAVGDFLEG